MVQSRGAIFLWPDTKRVTTFSQLYVGFLYLLSAKILEISQKMSKTFAYIMIFLYLCAQICAMKAT